MGVIINNASLVFDEAGTGNGPPAGRCKETPHEDETFRRWVESIADGQPLDPADAGGEDPGTSAVIQSLIALSQVQQLYTRLTYRF